MHTNSGQMFRLVLARGVCPYIQPKQDIHSYNRRTHIVAAYGIVETLKHAYTFHSDIFAVYNVGYRTSNSATIEEDG